MARVMSSSQPPSGPSRPGFSFPIPKFSLKRLIRLAILVFIFWILILIARTGLWEIPIISKYFYHEPQPIHSVEPPINNIKGIIDRVLTLVGQREIVLQEGELTLIAKQGAENLHLGITDIIIAADNSQKNLEMSFHIPQKRNAVIRLRLLPKLTSDSKLTFEPQKTLIGELGVPNWIVGEPVRFLLAAELQPVIKPLPKLQGVQVQTSGIRLTW